MKRQARRLQLIGRFIDLNKFYVITVYDTEIRFQAQYDPLMITKIRKMKGMTSEIDDRAYIKIFGRGLYFTFTN